MSRLGIDDRSNERPHQIRATLTGQPNNRAANAAAIGAGVGGSASIESWSEIKNLATQMRHLSRPPRGQQRDKPYREALRMELAAAGDNMKKLREIAKVHSRPRVRIHAAAWAKRNDR